MEKLERSKLEYERNGIALPIAAARADVESKKADFAFEQASRELAELEADRGRMVITAPSAGYVYYGRCVRGQWLGQNGKNRDLQIGQSVAHDDVMVTIVSPQWQLRAALTEEQLARITPDMTGLANPTAFPGEHTGATVSGISYIPQQPDQYDCTMTLDGSIDNLMAGMTCNVRFVIRQSDDAFTVPESAVFTDDGIQHYVYVAVEGGAPQRRNVTAGLTSDETTEILDGLAAGDVVLTERP